VPPRRPACVCLPPMSNPTDGVWDLNNQSGDVVLVRPRLHAAGVEREGLRSL